MIARERTVKGTNAEQRLILALCGLPAPTAVQVSERLLACDQDALLALAGRLNLVTLMGVRLRAAGASLSPQSKAVIETAVEAAQTRGRLHELVLLSVCGELAAAGIRGVPLKGTALSLAVHGDPGLRVSSDLDLLVAPDDLGRAVEIAQRRGWRPDAATRSGLPLLHARLTHPELPPLELHWRVHWYEERFAADALARAVAPTAPEPLRMAPVDELATLLLCHARDGLSGLRLPADISAWCGGALQTAEVPAGIAELAARHPRLAPALAVATAQLSGLVGLPLTIPAPLGWRERAAIRLANPFLLGGGTQIRADASFVDILLAPAGERGAAVRRQFDNAPTEPPARRSARGRHMAKTVGRWCASALHTAGAPRRAANLPLDDRRA